VEAPDDSLALLTVLTRNVARNQRRRHHRARTHGTDDELAALSGDAEPADLLVARAETYVTAAGCMATLGQMQKAVVELRLVDGIPGDAVAQLLGISAAQAAVLLHRAKGKLRSCITDVEK